MSESQRSSAEGPVLTLRFEKDQHPSDSLGSVIGLAAAQQHSSMNAIDAIRASDDEVGERWELEVQRSGAHNVIVDLGPSTYLNTHRISVLVRLLAMMKSRSGRVVIVAQERAAEGVLRRVQLHRVFRIVSTMESAMDALRRG